jgi:hypothetical protein
MTKKKINRTLIHISLLGLILFSYYMFTVNKENVDGYNLVLSKKISGQLLSFNKEKTRRTIYLNFQLKGLPHVFTVPSPEWKSFDFKSFNSNVAIGDLLTLTIPANVGINDKTIQVFQIQHGNKLFIDWEKMKQLRLQEMYLALALFFSGIIGMIHHYYRPWL